MSFGNRIRLWTSLTPLAAVLFLAACDESPTSEGSGESYSIDANFASTTRVVGRQFRVDARSLDRGLTPLPSAVEVTPSGTSLRVDSVVFSSELQESRIYVTPIAIDSTAYLVLSSGGVQDTVFVAAFPAAISASVPSDTLGSGESMQLTVNALSDTGADLGEVPFALISATTARVNVAADGTVTGKGPGEATIIVTGPGGAVRDTVVVEIVPGDFAGTVTAGAVNAGSALTITAPAGMNFDDDTGVRFSGNDEPFIVSQDSTQIVAIVPYGSDNTFTLIGVGADQLAYAGTFTIGTSADPNEPNDDPATAPEVALGTPIYGSVGEADADDFFTLTVTTAGTYTLLLEWPDGADIDLYVLNANADLAVCADDFLACAAGTGDQPETGTTSTLAPGTYRVYVSMFETSGPTTQYRLTVTRN